MNEKFKICFFILIFYVVANNPVSAAMIPVTDIELDAVTGQAFSNFEYREYTRGSDNCIKMRIDLDIRIEFSATIDQLRMGFYDIDAVSPGTNTGIYLDPPWYLRLFVSKGYNYGNGGGYGWNLNADNLRFEGYGSNSNFILDGLTIRTDYIIDGSGNKVLKTCAIGSDNTTGSIYASSFDSYSGVLQPALAEDEAVLTTVASMFDGMVGTWAFRTNMLNKNVMGTFFTMNVKSSGMHFRPSSDKTEGFYLVIDKDVGVGMYSGPPIAELYNYWP